MILTTLQDPLKTHSVPSTVLSSEIEGKREHIGFQSKGFTGPEGKQ